MTGKINSPHPLCESVQIRSYFCSVLSPNTAKYRPEKLRIWILFTQWSLFMIIVLSKIVEIITRKCNILLSSLNQVSALKFTWIICQNKIYRYTILRVFTTQWLFSKLLRLCASQNDWIYGQAFLRWNFLESSPHILWDAS